MYVLLVCSSVWCSYSYTNKYIACYSDPLSVPRLAINTATNTGVEYQVNRSDAATTRIIAGYEVFRFGVPMIGKYDNELTGNTVTISPPVPGAQYRITAWALGNGSRSVTPAVKSAITGEAGELNFTMFPVLQLVDEYQLSRKSVAVELFSCYTTQYIHCYQGDHVFSGMKVLFGLVSLVLVYIVIPHFQGMYWEYIPWLRVSILKKYTQITSPLSGYNIIITRACICG